MLLVAAENDVDAAAGHVRRDRDRALATRLGDDLRLALVLLRIEDVVRDAAARQELRQVLGGLDGDRADEHRLPFLVALGDVVERGVELRLLRAVDEVVAVVARYRHVRRDLRDVEPVDLRELLLLGLRRTGHPGELVVQAEVVLERDRRQRDVLLLDGHVLLRLDGLVEALRPAAAFHDPPRELVDDLHLAVGDDVLLVSVVERLCLQRLREVVDELDVARVVEVVDPERALDLLDAARQWRDGLELLVVRVVGVRVGAALDLRRRQVGNALQLLHDPREVVVRLRGRLRLAGDDERRARLVDEDRVDLVHDRVRVPLLDGALERHGHVVAEVVEAELRVRPVRDVAPVHRAALVERHEVLDGADGRAERLVDGPRPLGVALREVVVDGDEVDVASWSALR